MFAVLAEAYFPDMAESRERTHIFLGTHDTARNVHNFLEKVLRSQLLKCHFSFPGFRMSILCTGQLF
jgi:hypothetical protein